MTMMSIVTNKRRNVIAVAATLDLLFYSCTQMQPPHNWEFNI